MSKEIIYENKRKLIVVDNDVYDGYEYYIIDRGLFPTAYVEVKGTYQDYDDEKLSDIIVHGGFTYFGDMTHIVLLDKYPKMFVGWDYGHLHLSDYSPYFDNDGKKWTYEEILKEVHKVIEQLKEIEK